MPACTTDTKTTPLHSQSRSARNARGTPPRHPRVGPVLLALACCLAGAPVASAQLSAAALSRLAPLPLAHPHEPLDTSLPVGPDSLLAPKRPAVLRLPPPWELNATGKLSASQAAYSNWTEGGLNTLALTTSFDGAATRTSANWKQTHRARLAVGYIQQDTLTIRKADDRLNLSGSLQYQGNGFFRTFNPTFAASLRTQFLAGFNYDKNPFSDGREPPVKVSTFFAPATVTQSIGLTYEPEPWLAQRLSLGAKEVFVVERGLRPIYNLAPGDGMRYEAGLESTTELDRHFSNDVHVQSSLRLFAAFNREDAPDMIWENLVSLQFNSWLSVDFELATLYDGDVTRALQVREAFSLGASVAIL